MRTIRFTVKTAALFAILMLGSLAVQAQSPVKWVASNGVDGGGCGDRATPCRTFQQAHTNITAATGGQILVVDAADYGPVAITKSISIDAGGSGNGNALGNINLTSTNPAGATSAISVTGLGPGSIVVIRGLTIDTQNAFGVNGITYTGGGKLHVENCTITNYGNGILYQGNSPDSQLYVRDSVLRNNSSTGIRLESTVVGTLIGGFIENVKSDGNSSGMVATFSGVKATIRNFTAAGGSSGLFATNSAEFNVSLSVVSNNQLAGFTTTNAATIRIADSDIFNNAQAFNNPGGFIVTYGNNRIPIVGDPGNTNQILGTPPVATTFR